MADDKWQPVGLQGIPNRRPYVPGESEESHQEKYETITSGTPDHTEAVPKPSEIYGNWQPGIPVGYQGVPGYEGYHYPLQTGSAMYPFHLVQHPESYSTEDHQQRQTEEDAYVQHQQLMYPQFGQFPNFTYPYMPQNEPPPPYDDNLYTNRPVVKKESEISLTLGQQEATGTNHPHQMLDHLHHQQDPPYPSRQEQVHGGHNTTNDKTEKKIKSEDTNESAKPPMRLKVTNIPSTVSEDTVGYFFENKRRSGGGDIEEIHYDQKKGIAIIKFQYPEVIDRVMQKVPLSLGGKEIHLERSGDNEQIKTNYVIEVQGMKETTSNDTLESYFESKRAAGAFLDIVNFKVQEGDGRRVVYVTYRHRKDMEQVLQRQHILDGYTLNVQEYTAPLLYDNKIVVKGVNPVTTEDGLHNFLEAKSGVTPCGFLYGAEDGTVLVTFEESPDFEKLQEACKRRCLDGVFLQIHRIPISNCITVNGIGKTTGEDTIRYYFENNRRSGGCDITRLKFQQNDGSCLIWFENHEVIADVCKRNHSLDGNSLNVQLYYETLGKTISKDELSQFKLPEPVTIETLDTRKLHFLLGSKINSKAIEAQLQLHHAQINWPEVPSCAVVLECLLKEDDKDSMRLALAWKNKALNVLNKYLDAIIVERYEVLEDVWSIVLQKLQKIKFSNQPDGMTFIFEKTTFEIFVVGHQQFVKASSKTVEETIQQAVKDKEKGDKPVEDRLTLKRHEILILKFLQFKDKMENKYKVTINLESANAQVIFQGYASTVLTAKQEMFSIIQNIPNRKLTDVSYNKYRFLQNSQIQKYITKKMEVDQFIGIWDYEEDAFKIFSTNDPDVVTAAQILREILVEIKFDIVAESYWLLSLDSWDDVKNKAKSTSSNHIEFLFEPQSGRLTVFCTDVDSKNLKRLIETFLTDNAITEETLEIPDGIIRYMQQQKMKEIQNIEENLSKDHVVIECIFSKIVIKGTKAGIQRAHKDIEQLCQKIEKKVHVLKKPAVSMMMESDIGKEKIATIEREKGVTISSDDDWGRKGGSLLHEMALCETGRCNIHSVLGDITKLRADVVVNTTKKDLKHVGGLSKLIVEKGGRSIQDECTAHAKEEGHLSEGEVFCSGAGHLPCKMLVHAVGRTWHGGSNQEKEVLREVVLNCLKETNGRGMMSIAFPAIGTGARGIPDHIATSVIITAIKEFYEDTLDTVVADVYLCDVKQKNVTLFSEELKNIFGSDKVSLTDKPLDVQRTASEQNTVENMSENGAADKNVESSHLLELDVGRLQLKIYQGDITLAEVEVIVNNTNAQFDLSRGQVSKALKEKCGSDLEREVKKHVSMIPDQIMAVTSVDPSKTGMPCHHIVHVNMEGSSTNLKTVFVSVLDKCEGMNVKSVAFPVIGKAGVKTEPKYIAISLIDALVEFEQKRPRNAVHLQEVHLVTFQTVMFDKITDSMRQHIQNPRGPFQMNWIRRMINRLPGRRESARNLQWNPRYYRVMSDPEADTKVITLVPSYTINVYGDSQGTISGAINMLEQLLDSHVTK